MAHVNPKTGEILSADRLGRPLTLDGREIPDPTPVAPPVGYRRQPTMVEHIRNMVRSERLAQEVAAQGMETFEESEDFDDPDDPDDLSSQWENEFDPPVRDIKEAVEADKKKKATPPKAPPAKPSEASPEASPAPDEKSDD